jgi:hypothetical protein
VLMFKCLTNIAIRRFAFLSAIALRWRAKSTWSIYKVVGPITKTPSRWSCSCML